VKWAQNQSLGEKWAATSKRLRSTALALIRMVNSSQFMATHWLTCKLSCSDVLRKIYHRVLVLLLSYNRDWGTLPFNKLLINLEKMIGFFGPLPWNLPLFWTRFGPLAKSRSGNLGYAYSVTNSITASDDLKEISIVLCFGDKSDINLAVAFIFCISFPFRMQKASHNF